MPRLVGLEGPASGKALDFDQVVTIGRGEDCQFHIGDPRLSREHCVIHFDGTRAVLRDCDSANGTWYGENEIERIELREGDTFRIGSSVLRVEYDDSEDAGGASDAWAVDASDSRFRVGRRLLVGLLLVLAVVVLVRELRFAPSLVVPPQPAVTIPPEPPAAPPQWLGPRPELTAEAVETGQWGALRRGLATWLIERHANQRGLKDALEDGVLHAEYLLALVQHELLRAAGDEQLAWVSVYPKGPAFMTALLNDREWMESFLSSGTLSAPDRALLYLFHIWRHDPEVASEGIYRRLAIAIALEKADQDHLGDPAIYAVVRRYQLYKQNHQAGRLHGAFDDLEPWVMRYALELGGDERDLMALVDDHFCRVRDYDKLGVQGERRTGNGFGDDMESPLFYRPWRYRYGWVEAVRGVGGSVKSLSRFSAMSARAHGIPAMRIGGGSEIHVAYAIRNLDGVWQLCGGEFLPMSASQAYWSSRWTYLFLAEQVFRQPAAIRHAIRHRWQARLFLERRRPKLRFPVNYRLYRGEWKSLPDFSTLEPVASGVVSNLNLRSLALPAENFGIVFEGILEIPANGYCRLSTTSDDGSRLLIDGKTIVDNNGLHSRRRKDAVESLTKGTRKLRLEYFNGRGSSWFEADWLGAQRQNDVKLAYELALSSHPEHYGIWLEYGDFLEQRRGKSPEMWRRHVEQVAEALTQHQEAAWGLINRRLSSAVADLEGDARRRYLIDLHALLQESAVVDFRDYPFEQVINDHVGLLDRDRDVHLTFLVALLKAHAGSPHYFEQIVQWGSTRFSDDPRLASRFADAVESARSEGDKEEEADDEPL